MTDFMSSSNYNCPGSEGFWIVQIVSFWSTQFWLLVPIGYEHRNILPSSQVPHG